MSTNNSAEDFSINEKIVKIREALAPQDPSDRPSEAAIKLAARDEVAYEEMTPVVLSTDLTGIHEITSKGLNMQSKKALHVASADDLPTKPSMARVTKIMLPANCRGGMDGNVHADFCPNMSFCGRCLDVSKIQSTDVIAEMVPGPDVLDVQAYAEKLPAAKRGKIYLAALPSDLRKHTRFLPKRDAEKFAAAYAAAM